VPIEGPLRELGIHDVFQLLDLSRKTGTLRVVSELRDDEGVVQFDSGRVVHASIRSNPAPLEELLVQSGRVTAADLENARALQRENGRERSLTELLVDSGAITQRELERQVRLQLESVVFELMSWREGFFSFEERTGGNGSVRGPIRVSTESLLMEGARRIDEWSRIADKIPSLAVVPALAPVRDGEPSQLDLLPHEWEVLTMIDGARDLRQISQSLGRAEFDVAKIAYGLVTTGVVDVKLPERNGSAPSVRDGRAEAQSDQARTALAGGRADEALVLARGLLTANPSDTEARLLAARALTRLGRNDEALDELRRTVQLDPLTPEVHRDLGSAAARVGEFAAARASWEHFLRLAPAARDAARVTEALETVNRLSRLLEATANE
jgi:tetratricopeptide (TPR) repeat protein